MFTGIAWAMGAPPGGGSAGGGSILGSLMLPIAIFVIFYFLLIRPQQKSQKRHKELLKSLKKGDRVLTSGGIYGTIYKLRGDDVTLQIAENVRIRILRSAISSSLGSPKASEDDEDENDSEVPAKKSS